MTAIEMANLLRQVESTRPGVLDNASAAQKPRQES